MQPYDDTVFMLVNLVVLYYESTVLLQCWCSCGRAFRLPQLSDRGAAAIPPIGRVKPVQSGDGAASNTRRVSERWGGRTFLLVYLKCN